MSRRSRISVSLDDNGSARFCAHGLSDEEFRAYRGAMDGAKYVRALRASVASLDRVPAILVRLRKTGLGIGVRDMDPNLRTELQERATARDWLDLDAVKDRLERIERTLKAKGESLFPFQRIGVQWLARGHGRLLADDMGLGKSVQALVAMPASAAAIIVCPAAMKGEWKGFVARWRPSLRVTVLNGRHSFRWPEPGEVVIVNYDILSDPHDRKGVTGRACDGHLPPQPCPGCEKQIVFAGINERAVYGRARGAREERGDSPVVTTTRTAHKPSCSGFLEPEECPGCHPFLELVPRGIVLIEDEAQFLKNAQSNRHRRVRAIADVVRRKGGYVWALTGTPLENEPNELWAVLRCATVHDESFGSWDRFTKVFRARKLMSGGYEWGLPGEEIKAHLQRVMLRRLKKDVQPQLPPKLRKVHEVELNGATYQRIDQLLRGSGRTVEEVVRLLEIDEINFKEMSAVRAALAMAKIPRLLEVVQDYEERRLPLIVFSDHRSPVDAVGKRPGWVVITGSESPDQKTRAKDEFQNGFLAGDHDRSVLDTAGVRRRTDPAGNIVYPRGIALTIKAGGTGLTLTRAAHMVFVDRAWNAQVNRQAEDRFDRIGQTASSLDIMDLVSNHPLDARVNEVIVRKMKLFEVSINVAADREMVSAEAAMMRQLREEQEAIAAGRATRRSAKNPRERGAWEALHTLIFDDVRDEWIASELAEQADTIGLSDKQWSLAIVITRKGRRVDEPKPAIEVATSVPCTGERGARERGASSNERGRVRPERSESEALVSGLVSGQQGAVSGQQGAIAPPPSPSPPPTRTLTPIERRRLEWARR